MRDSFIRKVILSHSPHGNTDFSAFAILNQRENLAYCRNGRDEAWRIVDGVEMHGEDVIYFNRAFYAVDKFGSIAVCDLNGDSPVVKFINVVQQIDGDMKYLVDAMGDLLLVARYLEFHIDMQYYMEVCKTVKFCVFRFDWNGHRWEELANLHDRVLVLGDNSSLALLASDYRGCRGNMIYFTDDHSGSNRDGVGGDHDVGVYNLGDGSIHELPCYPRWPSWITPSLC